tara:strand:- start:303 stop:803 length:501 start_codon:yes stop_codon:yes gene_type:complete
MKKEAAKKQKLPKSLKFLLVVSFILYLWYFISALLIPISKFLAIPTPLLMTLYKMLNFPVSLLGFILCISIISSVIIILQFNEQKYSTKLLLIESTSLVLYYLIPVVATILVLLLIALRVINYLPSVNQISFFLEDLFIFTTFLFLLTAILNIAMQRIIHLRKKKK